VTGTPRATLPPTDALDGDATPIRDGSASILVLLASLVATILLVTPVRRLGLRGTRRR
jgi:hypothetical protein